jgi:TolB-like protein/class 3 adenylate cyclase
MTDFSVENDHTGPGQLARRQLAILAADIADYSRLTEAAEESTHTRVRALRVEIINPTIVSHRGQVIRNTGDGFIAAFDSCVDALRCSLEIQRDVALSEAAEPPDRRIRIRMGLNVGDVIIEPEDIYGTSVNVAARLEQYATPGGIVISSALRNSVTSRVDVRMDDLGELRLKNISRPVRAYSLHFPGADNETMAGATTPSAAKRAKPPSIVVLPFRTGGANPEDAYFGGGMVDDIIVSLASIRGLLVISHSSAWAYRTGDIDIQKVGQELGVRYVLSGSVRRSETKIRINSELSDVQLNSVIWADRYDGALSELFDLQDRIATRIVWSVAPHIREAELKRALRKRPDNMNAYELVLQAIDLIYRMQYADFSRARSLLSKAIEADDSYAVAYAYAALWQVHYINQGWTHDVEADSNEAARLATAAVERDPADGFALAILGHARAVLFRDYDGAKELFDRALAAAPSNAMAWTLSSGVYSYTGDGKAAIERAEKGLRLSPVDSQSFFYLLFLAIAHYANRSYEEAVIWGRKSMGINPRLCSNLRFLIGSFVAMGKLDEARHLARTLLDVQPRFGISTYARWCPLTEELRVEFLERLRLAGIPD